MTPHPSPLPQGEREQKGERAQEGKVALTFRAGGRCVGCMWSSFFSGWLLLGTFTALVIATISFALWDRRTMLRPVEGRVTSLEEEMAGNRPRTAALLDFLRTLSQRDPELAAVLKTFNL